MSLNWKCTVDSETDKKRVLIYDYYTKNISGADFIKPKNVGQNPYFVLDCGGTKNLNDVVFYCECPEMDFHVLKVYKNSIL